MGQDLVGRGAHGIGQQLEGLIGVRPWLEKVELVEGFSADCSNLHLDGAGQIEGAGGSHAEGAAEEIDMEVVAFSDCHISVGCKAPDRGRCMLADGCTAVAPFGFEKIVLDARLASCVVDEKKPGGMQVVEIVGAACGRARRREGCRG